MLARIYTDLFMLRIYTCTTRMVGAQPHEVNVKRSVNLQKLR